jgi:hypothetical protein
MLMAVLGDEKPLSFSVYKQWLDSLRCHGCPPTTKHHLDSEPPD